MPGEVAVRALGRAPERVDLVYCYRPLDELPVIVDMAKRAGARAGWLLSGLAIDSEPDVKGCWLPDDDGRQARTLVQAAGLRFIDDVYIADAVRRLARFARRVPPSITQQESSATVSGWLSLTPRARRSRATRPGVRTLSPGAM